MVITFFGHADFNEASICQKDFLSVLYEHIKEAVVDFYFGGYGAFDEFSYKCCQQLKSSDFKQNSFKFTFVTPYITEDYRKNNL